MVNKGYSIKDKVKILKFTHNFHLSQNLRRIKIHFILREVIYLFKSQNYTEIP